MTFVPLKPEVTQKILEMKTSDRETQQWAGEVTYFQEKDGKTKQKTRYILLTECCFYLIVKEKVRGNFKLRLLESHFDLTEITANNDEMFIKFRGQQHRFIFPETSTLYTLYIKQLKNLKWIANTKSIGTIDVVLNTPQAQEVPAPKTRPPNLLLFRYIASSIAKNTELEPKLSLLFNVFDEGPRTVMRFDKFNVQSPAPAFFSVSLESQIKNLVFNEFSPDNLGPALNWIMTTPNKISSLDFLNYKDANLKGISMKRSNFNHLTTVRFISCSSDFLLKFFETVKPANYAFETLVFNNIYFSSAAISALINLMQSSTVLSSVESIAFIQCKCHDTTMYDFACQIAKQESLKSIHIENCSLDICDYLMEIARIENSSIQYLSLRKNKATTVVGHDETVLVTSLLHLDVGDCTWTSESFISFITSVCRRNRRHPLALSVDKAKIDAQWNEVFENLPYDTLTPVITELDISNNLFDLPSFELFLKFIDTQTPLFSQANNRLLHLSLNHCWNEKTKDTSEDCLQKLTTFFETRELWGLEICGVKPTMDLLKISNLHALNIGGSFYDQSCLTTLTDFINKSTTIAELGIDNIKCKDVNSMLQFYLNLSQNPRLLAIDTPTMLYKEFQTYNEVKKIKANLLNKRTFSNTHQRLSLFLSLAGDFATRIVQLIDVEEKDDDTSESFANKPEYLLDAKYHNPVPSLFTLATLVNIDVNVDPIAAMVTEYVATSGRFGIVPPTAPPPEPPKTEFGLPSIFATMNTKTEIADEQDFDFDPDDPQIEKISETLANKMKLMRDPIEMTSNSELWNNKAKLVSFFPMSE